eukprot:7261407-Prymnesium_polylepis.1
MSRAKARWECATRDANPNDQTPNQKTPRRCTTCIWRVACCALSRGLGPRVWQVVKILKHHVYGGASAGSLFKCTLHSRARHRLPRAR